MDVTLGPTSCAVAFSLGFVLAQAVFTFWVQRLHCCFYSHKQLKQVLHAGCALGHEVGSASVERLRAACARSCVGFQLCCKVREDLVECGCSMGCRF